MPRFVSGLTACAFGVGLVCSSAFGTAESDEHTCQALETEVRSVIQPEIGIRGCADPLAP